MKLFVLVLLGLFAVALSDHNDQNDQHYRVADKAFLEKQRRILRLFNHINQPSHYKEHVEIANSFHFGENIDHYQRPVVIRNFNQYLKYGSLLRRGEIFSVFHMDHLEQAVALFKVFYYANDFETFYRTAVWARQNINEGTFLYAFSVAVIHRPDTYGIIIPPIHEVYPHYFFNSEVIQEAYRHKQIHHHHHHDNQSHEEHGGYRGYTVVANYSGHYLNLHPEQSMSYYLEDIGINSFYYYYNLHYPFWMSGEEFGIKNDKRGELYYFVHQQMMARYYLERISNGFGEIPYFNWEVPIETPYYPSMQYPNGLEFPTRPSFARLQEYFYNYGQSKAYRSIYGYSYTFIHDIERRIRDAIDIGYVTSRDGKHVDIYSEDGFNIIGNIIEGNHDSVHRKYYSCMQIFARHLLGYSYQPMDAHHVAPSAMEHFETSARDPIFYQYIRKVVGYFQKYKMYQPAYTEEELEFPGVNITNFDVDDMVTYRDYFYSDISNAVYDSDEELEHDTFHVRARQWRLNHKPFTYRITVTSDKAVRASVKVFLGPKYDEYGRHINISQNRVNMVEIDHFVHNITSGENIIKRNSYEVNSFGPDRISFDELYKQVEEASEGHREFHIDGRQNYFYFPQRYMIPRGSHGGTTYQFYVFVYPYQPYNGRDQQIGEYYYPRVGSGGIYVDGYPVGYPFDRSIQFDEIWHEIPNSYFHEVQIYHKDAEEINATHQ